MKTLTLSAFLTFSCLVVSAFSPSPACLDTTSAPHTDSLSDKVKFLIKELKKPESNHIMVVAHRGDWRNAPENSILALRYAARMGVDMVEVDLKKTKDNVLIAMHDSSLDRTTTGKGEVKDFLWSDLQKLFLRKGGGGTTRHRIPSFKEYMLTARELGVLVNVDKAIDYAKEIGEILLETQTTDIALVKSGMDPDELTDILPLLNGAHYLPVVGLDGHQPLQKIDRYITNFSPFVMEISFQTDTSSFFNNPKELLSRGVKIWTTSCSYRWCAGHDDEIAVDFEDPENSWGWLLDKKATIFLTDRPGELLDYLEQKGLRDPIMRKYRKTTLRQVLN